MGATVITLLLFSIRFVSAMCAVAWGFFALEAIRRRDKGGYYAAPIALYALGLLFWSFTV
jgi:hypothetical protein